ncbi:MAG: hypothetical protein IPM85_16790 [Chitinophagaceae bacterium]|nr:hypothetical protein [Chitinophagaceae bacterium]
MEAIETGRQHKINHLILHDEEMKAKGVFRISAFYGRLFDRYSLLNEDIKNAETTDEIKQMYQRLQKQIISLVKSGLPAQYITGILTTFSDAVTVKVIEMAIRDYGHPPANFSFISLGSEGRKEETLLTDQDNALIIEDFPKEKETIVIDYFTRLSLKINESLHHIGYAFCKGNIMAMNPKWCKPYSAWVKYFREWISTPEPQNLLEATIFFDFRTVYGDASLTDSLKEKIGQLIKENPVSLYHLAYNTVQLKTPHLISGNIHSEKIQLSSN